MINIIHHFRLADFFDIFVMAVFAYTALIWFKKTTSRFVFIGLLVLGLIYIVALFMQMYLTVFVLKGFFAILIIAMVVIFQEDLRRFFEQIGMWGIFSKRRFQASPYPEVDVLIRGITSLVRKKYGALIVLKGLEPLDRHLQGGTPLEGILSEGLLESLFDPHSLGHDGAVIVEHGRIVKFGCHLPLSSNIKEIGNRGLRHTAALGLSEHSDALCIVVSEERQTISIAKNGRLKKLNNVEQLRPIIEHFYQQKFPKSTPKGWLRRLMENPLEKGLALLLACGLWLVFGYQKGNIYRDFVVPIEFQNLSSDWVIDDFNPKEVTVTLVGSKQAFSLLNPQELKVTIDMSKIKEGAQTIFLTEDMVHRPLSLLVVKIKPNRIELLAHQLISINVPIKVQTSGSPPPGTILKKITVAPQFIQVLTPKKKIPSNIPTEPIDLRNIAATTTLSANLIFPSYVKPLKENSVKVTIETERILSIFFDLNRTTIKPQFRPILNNMVQILKKNPHLRLTITGYATPTGPKAYNQRLAQRRAQAVFGYLVKNGVSPKQLNINFAILSSNGHQPQLLRPKVELKVIE